MHWLHSNYDSHAAFGNTCSARSSYFRSLKLKDGGGPVYGSNADSLTPAIKCQRKKLRDDKMEQTQNLKSGPVVKYVGENEESVKGKIPQNAGIHLECSITLYLSNTEYNCLSFPVLCRENWCICFVPTLLRQMFLLQHQNDCYWHVANILPYLTMIHFGHTNCVHSHKPFHFPAFLCSSLTENRPVKSTAKLDMRPLNVLPNAALVCDALFNCHLKLKCNTFVGIVNAQKYCVCIHKWMWVQGSW